jgi:Fe-S cluster biogenesis protein NfuA
MDRTCSVYVPGGFSAGGLLSRRDIFMKEKVLEALQLIRPALQNDGGDVELVDVNEESGIVQVRLTGACGSCPMSTMTLKMGVERVLKEAVPEIVSVEAL